MRPTSMKHVLTSQEDSSTSNLDRFRQTIHARSFATNHRALRAGTRSFSRQSHEYPIRALVCVLCAIIVRPPQPDNRIATSTARTRNSLWLYPFATNTTLLERAHISLQSKEYKDNTSNNLRRSLSPQVCRAVETVGFLTVVQHRHPPHVPPILATKRPCCGVMEHCSVVPNRQIVTSPGLSQLTANRYLSCIKCVLNVSTRA